MPHIGHRCQWQTNNSNLRQTGDVSCAIVNLLYSCKNIPLSSVLGVYVSQHIRFDRDVLCMTTSKSMKASKK